MGVALKANVVADGPDEKGNSVANLEMVRRWLREAIEEGRDPETGEPVKYDAVAAAIDVPPTYLSQMLSIDPRNQKPIQWRHIIALPDYIEALFSRKYAESFGHVVVQPVAHDEALRQLATGLFSLLTPAPAPKPREARMAKAGLR